MAGLPKVRINIVKDRLGLQTAAEDGTSLLLVGMVDTHPLYSVLFDGKLFTSLRNAEDEGITSASDIANNALVWEHIKDFYTNAPTGTQLHVMSFESDTSYVDLFDAANTPRFSNYLADKLGNIKLVGVAANTSVANDSTKNNVTDIVAAMTLVQAFANTELAAKRPISIFLECRNFNASNASPSLRTITDANRVSVFTVRQSSRVTKLLTDGINIAAKMAAIGFLLGNVAKIPVQRSLARVKNGDVGWVDASFSNGTETKVLTEEQLGILSDKGFIAVRKHMSKNGYFFTKDPTCTEITDDYNAIHSVRVMDKVFRIVNSIYTNELEDEFEVNDNGTLEVSAVKNLQNICENAIVAQMQVGSEISKVLVSIDPLQNVLTTSELEVEVYITQKGIVSLFKVNIGFAAVS
jgi:Protein of unknown function (DUF2586)